MIHLDTSALIDALTFPHRSAPRLRALIADGERVQLSALVLYEWLRGPRVDAELEAQEALFPAADAVPFGPREAGIAAHLYRALDRPRARTIELAIAACALGADATLFTLNERDFTDVPGLRLVPVAAPRTRGARGRAPRS